MFLSFLVIGYEKKIGDGLPPVPVMFGIKKIYFLRIKRDIPAYISTIFRQHSKGKLLHSVVGGETSCFYETER